VVALKGMFMQAYDLPKFASRSKLDGFLWIGSFLAVILMDIDTGLEISIGLSLLILLYRSIAVSVDELGAIEDTGLFGKRKDFERAERKENAILLNIGGPITFANFDAVLEKLRRTLKHIPRTAPLVVSNNNFYFVLAKKCLCVREHSKT
jgi:MFS superfamily sulfate permease-like transporter